MQHLSIVDMNNQALSRFLHGDFDQAKRMLEFAYDLCQKRLENFEETTVSNSWDPSLSPGANRMETVPPQDLLDEDESTWDDDDETMMGMEVLDHDNRLISIISSSIPKDDNNTSPTGTQSPLRDHASESDWNSTDTPENPFHSPLPCCLPSGSSSVSTICSSSVTMYNRGLVLSPRDETNKHLVRTSSIVLYNLALINHNVGIRCGISKALWEALQLYEKSLEILDRHMPTYQQPFPCCRLSWMWRILDVEKLLLALFNNMGNIHAHLFHLENTNACMKSLRIVLDAITATSRLLESNNTATVMDEDYTFFLLNSLFQGKELCFAPAA